MKRATLKDVAARAGLSVTQVSRALNDHDDVALATKEHARRVAAELHYVPNLGARRLQDPAIGARTIGLVLPTETLKFSDPFFGDLLSSMVARAGKHGYQLQLSTPPADAAVLDPYDHAIRQKTVDGFVLVRTLLQDPRIDFLLERGFPFVSFGRPSVGGGFTSVDIVPEAFAAAIGHLVELGHRRLACLAEPPQFAIGAHRLESFRAAVAPYVASGAIDEPTVFAAGFHEDDGLAASLKLLTDSEPPSAIVALNDLLALGTLQAAERLGRVVPDNVSVIGFDDIAAARLVQPSLTTLRQSAPEIGEELIDELLPLMKRGENAERQFLVGTDLIIRNSTGPHHS